MLTAGAVLAGRYRLEQLLGTGGSAHTWAAFDLLDEREVALKLLRDPASGQAFRAEFTRLSELSHPHLIRVRAFGHARVEQERAAYYASDLVKGCTLREHAERCGWSESQRALWDALSALAFLHRVGLRHGDLKPENVLVDEAGRGVLIDLGFTVPFGAPMLGGTPRYMAPELVRGEPADQRADLYALGVMLRELGFQGPFARLAERLAQPDAAARPSSLASALSESGVDTPFERMPLGYRSALLGRDAPMHKARATLTPVAARKSGPRVVWIEGPRGVGATRFVAELCFQLSELFDVYEASAERESVRALLARAFGPCESGVEALVQSVELHAERREPTLLVVHDVDRASPEHIPELALALGATRAEGVLGWVVSSTRGPPPELDADSVLHLSLEPLSQADLALWAGALLPEAQSGALLAQTGGFPLYVERVLSALSSGVLASDALGEEAAAGSRQAYALSALLTDLDGSERALLAGLAVGLRTRRQPSARLIERGLLQKSAGEWRLGREADAPVLMALLPRALLQKISLRAADECSAGTDELSCAKRIAHLARAGETKAALALFRDSLPLARRAPRTFVTQLRAVTAQMGPAELVLTASLSRESGEPRRALGLLARARRSANATWLDALWLEAAESYIALGALARAGRALERLRQRDSAACLDCRARVALRLGDYAGARALAEEALRHPAEPALRARLQENLALCCSYLGLHREAEEQLAAAAASEPEPVPRIEARRWALSGFLAMRRADPEAALAAYEKALARADEHGLADLVANALLNLANARHMLGSYGTARDLYERALRMAVALGRKQSERVLRANLANLALEVGAFEEAAQLLDKLAALPASAPLSAAVRRYRAELALLTHQPELALSLCGPAEDEAGEERERQELELLRLEAHLSLGDWARAGESEARLSRHAADFEPDLSVRYELARGRLSLERGEESAALSRFERAAERARSAGLVPLLARSEAALAEHCARTGAPNLAREQRAKAEARWERMALDLPKAARDTFWNHPQRRRRETALSLAPPAQSRTSLTFVRVVELSRRINAQRTVADVLSFALDAALELTSAERGFVLVHEAQSGSFRVRCQRHLDPEALSGAGAAFSRSIAERVIQSGEAVITLDAEQDPRFKAEASVHAMGLKSVLCVPFRGSLGPRGALYLDNRYLRSRFSESDALLVQAFAEQVAVALGNAQLLEELSEKQRELSRKQRKVEELLRGKEREVELLAAALAEERSARGTRFSYEEMIGNSAGLRRLFATLDRVIPTDLPVIVRGESGTGKELVARALHTKGPRAARPFVSLNCAALPENLLESELFGHVKGAFTGAERDKPGLFVAAHGGSLFLDEIGELPLPLQAKLLRVLTSREVRPVGGNRAVPIDVRIIAATHRDLQKMRDEGTFREDLYYRLSVVELALPPLRERSEDIIPIAESLLARRAEEQGAPKKRLSSDAAQALTAYPFPGNVRELENILLRASALSEGELIRSADLGLSQASAPRRKPARSRADFRKQEAEQLLEALRRERWNVSAVARSLAMPRNTLYRKLARFGIALRPA